MSDASIDQRLDLNVGDWVVVRSAQEILSTLDENARLDELPFMPQMLKHCGTKLQVRKTAHKLCDTVHGTGGRKMSNAVFLDDIRCDGASFGGCEMKCTIVWKEAWLKRAEASEPASPEPASPATSMERLEALAQAGTRRPSSEKSPAEPLYVCQATQLPVATTLLPWWKPGQYWDDYKRGNVPLREISSRLFFVIYSELVSSGLGFGSALRWLYNVHQKLRGGHLYPVRRGRLRKGGPTPAVNLGLEIGELVRVKDSEAILGTVDEMLFNRGMSFSPEMMPYCGKTFRVTERVRKIINEKTGQLVDLKNSCLVLDGTHCHGRYSRPLNCPRACPPYWREIWLERAEPAADPGTSAQQQKLPAAAGSGGTPG